MSTLSYAYDLAALVADAFKHDPTYLGAEANFKALKEAYPQALASVLPNITLAANASATKINVSSAGSDASTSIFSPGTNSFGVNNYTVTLTQPIFNFSYFMQLKQADEKVKEAYADYLAAGQDLIVRASQAYFAVLLAQDTLSYAKANTQAVYQQWLQAKVRYQAGLETKTAVYEAKAAYDSSVSREIMARNDLENSKESLRAFTGFSVDDVDEVDNKKFKLLMPNPLNVASWIQKSNQQNLNLQAARFAMMAAQKQIKVNYAGHMPTLNLVTDYGRQNNAYNGLANFTQSDVGVQLAVPIYAGGQVNSEIRQAKYQYVQASETVEKAYRDTFIATRQLFNNVVSDVSKVKADRQSVISNASSLQSTQAAYTAGTRTMVDVLLAISNDYQAKQTLAQDTYAYLEDTLLLKQQAGILSQKDIVGLNRWLKNRIEGKK